MKILLPVVPERWPRFALAVLVAIMFDTVVGAHVVERPGDGGLPAIVEDIICRRLPRTAAARSTIQARARSDCRKPVSAKASVPRTVRVTPLPARILPNAEVLDVTWRRQGWWSLFACSWDGHGDSWAGLRWAVVVWQCVAVGFIYPNARGAARGRHNRASRASRR